MRPGIDGIALIKRYYSSFLKKQFVTKNISELNQEILNLEINDTQKNRLMLNCTGHILFISSSIKS